MQVSRGIKEAIKAGIEEMVVDSWGIELVSRNNSSDPRTKARSIQQVSRSYQWGRSFLNRSTRYRGAVGIAIRKSLKSSTDSKVSRRCWASFSKQFFERRKTQIWMQSNTQLNQWSNQHNNLSESSLKKKKFKHMDLKNTHTKQV